MKKVNDLVYMRKYFPEDTLMKKINVTALSAMITTGICLASYPVYASDIEIYKVPEESVGSTTLLFMLDTSGSMGTRDEGTGFPTRMEYLKQGMKDVLFGSVNNEPLDGKTIIGLSTFTNNNGVIRLPTQALSTPSTGEKVTNKKEYFFSVNGQNYECTSTHSLTETCKTWVAKGSISTTGYSSESCYLSKNCTVYYKLGKTRGKEYRDEIYSIASGLSASGTTPTPYAYAETAAYLLGTSSVPRVKLNNAPVYYALTGGYSVYWQQCNKFNSDGTACLTWGGWQSAIGGLPSNLKNGLTEDSCGTNNNVETQYSATKCYYKTGDYFTPSSYSGITGSPKSVSSVLNDMFYIQPESLSVQATDSAKKECSGQGIYFLTDGQPEPAGVGVGQDNKSGSAYEMMTSALGAKASSFDCTSSPLGKLKDNEYFKKDRTHAWTCIGRLAEALLDPSKNPANIQIKTAVVGFGNAFNGKTDPSNDVKEAMQWGVVGGGGWYSGSNSKDIVDSVSAFVTELVRDIPSLSTGTSVIPEDALNPTVIQGYAYFPQFEPKVNPVDTNQIWFGNLKKYYVVNNGVYASAVAPTVDNLVVNNGVLKDIPDIWKSNRSYADNYPVFAKHGALSQLKLGHTLNVTNRNLLTDYKYDNNTRVKDAKLIKIKHTYTTDQNTKSDTTYSNQLMGLLGYDIPTTVEMNNYDLTNVSPDLRQMGAPLHSEPMLLTQSGKVEVRRNSTTNQIETITTGRQDYVLFGTTQGLVHVVDSNTGVEKFAFVPKEIIEKQSETFKNKGGNLVGGKNALYYGMDGEWTNHSVYVTDKDGVLTAGTVERPIYGSSTTNQKISGHQWAYGGMRMGGRSYYALDLSDIEKPNLKFHIEPNSGKVYSYDPVSEVMSTKTYNDISQMGQSWSKPVLGYVNWKGSRKLVMFVGGGYDAGGDNGDGLYSNNVRTGYAGYEQYNYTQSNGIGSGVYMFDAENGDLLWKASATNKADSKVKYLTQPDLKYSVVSSVHTVDRNNDGIVDHLYFGDLAGQAFRVDFANDGQPTNSNFTSQVTKILNVNKTDGNSPRFYLPPTFTAHSSSGKPNGANIVMAIFASGNKSSPLLGTSDSPTKQNTSGLEYNGVYAIYDFDAYNNNLGEYPYYTATEPLRPARTLAAENANAGSNVLKYMNGASAGASTSEWGGWYYLFKQKMDESVVGVNGAGAGIIKALRPLIAMENNLYVSQFDPTDNGTTTSCGAGVKGHTFATRICLPQGICTDGAKYTYNLGSGDVKLNVGPGSTSGARELVVPDPTNAGGNKGKICTGEGCGGGFIPAGGPIKFIPNKWYEKYSRIGNTSGG